jgi:hypothetical protein
MKSQILVSAFLFASAVVGPAWAAPVTGRITYLDLNGGKLMLDSSELYSIAPAVTSASLRVGQFVTVDVTKRGTEKVVTKVLKFN